MTQKEFASMGGKARAAKLTRQDRIRIARWAGVASGKKRAIKAKTFPEKIADAVRAWVGVASDKKRAIKAKNEEIKAN
jgi:hypothetical protein